jgi:hypothetical protein
LVLIYSGLKCNGSCRQKISELESEILSLRAKLRNQDLRLELDDCKGIFRKHYLVDKLPRLYQYEDLKKLLDAKKNNTLNLIHEAVTFKLESRSFDDKIKQRCIFLVHILVFMKNKNINVLQVYFMIRQAMLENKTANSYSS